MELMVALVLVSLLATLVIQSVSFFLARYETVQRVSRDTRLAALHGRWFAGTVRGLIPLGDETRRFNGTTTAFAGTTLQPLRAESGTPAAVRWSIGRNASESTLSYAESSPLPGDEWRILAVAEQLAFEYADAAGRWHPAWPVQSAPSEWLPSMIRLVRIDQASASPSRAAVPASTLMLGRVEASVRPLFTRAMLE